MSNERIEQLIERLSLFINSDGANHPVSPANMGASQEAPKLSKDMELKNLPILQLCLIHTYLHRFYPKGIGDITKTDIEYLHNEIRKHIRHDFRFDQLDDLHDRK